MSTGIRRNRLGRGSGSRRPKGRRIAGHIRTHPGNCVRFGAQRPLPPGQSDTSRAAAEDQLHSVVGHFHAQAIFAAPDADLFLERRCASRHNLCAAVRNDRPRHPSLFAPSELHVDWCMSNQAVSPSADERPKNGRPIADVSRDAFESRLAIMNVNQVRTIEDSGFFRP